MSEYQYKVVDAGQLDNDLKSVADTIRENGGASSVLSFPEDFNKAIGEIFPTEDVNEQSELIRQIKETLGGKVAGKEEQIKSLDVTVNGTYNVLPDTGKVLRKATVNVNVPDKYNEGYEQGKIDGKSSCSDKHKTAILVEENGKYFTPDGYTAIECVIVEVPVPDGYVLPSGTKKITENGTHNVTDFASVEVNVVGSSGGGDPDLPAGYRRVGYIQFSKAQIVDTGIICTQNTKIKVHFTREGSTAMYLYGVVNNGNTASVTAYLSSTANWRFGDKTTSITITENKDLIQTSIQSKSGVDRITASNSYSGVSDFETPGALVIGSSRNSNGSIGVASYVGRIFLFEIYEGNEMVLKLIPVVSSEGVYRFFDTVSQTFFDSVTATPLYGGSL